MTRDDLIELWLLAWYQNGVRMGRYLVDVPYINLNPAHREKELLEAQIAAGYPFMPKRRTRKGDMQWVVARKKRHNV